MDIEHAAIEAQKEINEIRYRINTAVMLAMKTLEPVDHLLKDSHGNEKVTDLRDTLTEQMEDAFYEALQERQDIVNAADAAEDEAHQKGVRGEYMLAQMGSVRA